MKVWNRLTNCRQGAFRAVAFGDNGSLSANYFCDGFSGSHVRLDSLCKGTDRVYTLSSIVPRVSRTAVERSGRPRGKAEEGQETLGRPR